MLSGDRSDESITQLLGRADVGDGAASEELYARVYEALHSTARRLMANEVVGHTLSATALVHETFLRISRRSDGWADRQHFLRSAAAAMRHLENHKHVQCAGAVIVVHNVLRQLRR